MRFVSFSRGAFETTSLRRKSRKWGRQPLNYLLLLGAVLAIGGVIGGIKYRTNNRYAYGWGGGGNDIISPLSASEAVTGAEASGSDDGKGTGEGTGEGNGGEGNGANGGTLDQREGDEGTEGQSSQGDESAGEAREGNRGEENGSVREGGQEEGLPEKEALKKYLQERSSPLGDYVDFIYQEELNAGIHRLSKLVVAIAGAESNFGKVCPIHNAWGVKCGRATYCVYLSWEESIQAISKLLASPLYGFNGQVNEGDIWRIASIYAESLRWPYDVVYFWRELE